MGRHLFDPLEVKVHHVMQIELVILWQFLVERNLQVLHLVEELDSLTDLGQRCLDWTQLSVSRLSSCGFLSLNFSFGVFGHLHIPLSLLDQSLYFLDFHGLEIFLNSRLP